MRTELLIGFPSQSEALLRDAVSSIEGAQIIQRVGANPDRVARRLQVQKFAESLAKEIGNPKPADIQRRINAGYDSLFQVYFRKYSWLGGKEKLPDNFDKKKFPDRLRSFLRADMKSEHITWLNQDIAMVLKYGLADGNQRNYSQISTELGYKLKSSVNSDYVYYASGRFLTFLNHPVIYRQRYI